MRLEGPSAVRREVREAEQWAEFFKATKPGADLEVVATYLAAFLGGGSRGMVLGPVPPWFDLEGTLANVRGESDD